MKKILIVITILLSFANARILFTCGIIKVPTNLANGCFSNSDYSSCKAIAKKYADDKSCYWDIMAYAKPPVSIKHSKKRYKKRKIIEHKRVTKRKRKHIFKHKKYAKKRKQKSYKKKSRVVHKRVSKLKRKRYSASSHKQKKIKNSATNKVTKKIDMLSVAKKPLSAKVVPQSKEKVINDKSEESAAKKIEAKSDIDLTLIKATVKKDTKLKAKKKKVKAPVDTKSLNKFF